MEVMHGWANSWLSIKVQLVGTPKHSVFESVGAVVVLAQRNEAGREKKFGRGRGGGVLILYAHPRCPEMTLKSFQGGCQTGLGHLLGSRRATAALGVYSLLPPAAVGSRALLAPLAMPFMAPCRMSCC